MGQLDLGAIRLGYRKWGSGARPLFFVHGNVASKDWMALTAQHLDARFCLHGVDWRGCGDSDKPETDDDFSNYSLPVHAGDMLAAIAALGLARVDLITHSTGGIIANHMQLMAPERIGRILALAPVAPMGLPFPPEAQAGFVAMKANKALTRDVMATTMPTLFVDESLAIGTALEFREATTKAQRDLFERIVEQSFAVSDGIWFGTPHHLDDAFRSQSLTARMGELRHPQRIIWGARDHIIPRVDMERMARELPDCELLIMRDIGHSMNVEAPRDFAAAINAFF